MPKCNFRAFVETKFDSGHNQSTKLSNSSNISAMIKHLTDDQHPDQSNHRDKLSIEAFTHIGEIRRLLQQITDRQAFMMVKSSSEALSTAMWKTNQESSHTMDRRDQYYLDRGLCLSHAKMNTKHGTTTELDLSNHS